MEQLDWNPKDNTPLDFINHYWKWIETTFSQWSQGNHQVTKAYNSDNDYLSFTDDYDFCWGPDEEGTELPEGEREYTERLWGVYAKTAGEIYLLKANEQLTGWERHELLTFAPSGSRRPTIEFTPDGHYHIAVEFTPAGTETAEIWLMSYPYEDEYIRKECDGKEPQLFMDHLKQLIVFYGSQNQLNIHYRFKSESYDTEYTVDDIYTPERQLHLTKAFKIFNVYEKINDSTQYIEEIVFYRRDDDYQPLKWIKKDIVNPMDSINEIKNTLTNISWEDMAYIINTFIFDNETRNGVGDAELTIQGQDDQNTIVETMDSGGTKSIRIIPNTNTYGVSFTDDVLGTEDSFGILVNNEPDKEIDIDLPFLKGANNLEDIINSLNNNLENIEWVLANYDIYITVTDSNGNLEEGTTVTFYGQESQDTVSGVTDSNGEVHLKVLPYSTPYDISLEDTDEQNMPEGVIGILVDGHDDTYSMTITLEFYDYNLEDIINSLENTLTNISWEDMTFELNITLTQNNGTAISSADITFHAQEDQDSITVTTDSNGQATINKILPYSTPYDVTITHSTIEDEEDWGVLVDSSVDDGDKIMAVDLGMLESINNLNDSISSISNTLESILWVEV